MSLKKEHIAAIHAAIHASNSILQIYQHSFNVNHKSDGSPITDADCSSSEIISEALVNTAIPIINEENEAAPYSLRKTWDTCWCVDPLDGTKEFVKKNGQFAVNIALIENNRPVFGVISHPVEQRILYGGIGYGVFIADFNGLDSAAEIVKSNFPAPKSNLTMIASSSHHNKLISDFAGNNKNLISQFIQKGSALKFFDLALNKAQIYPRFAPTMEWDIAAGHAILEALGGGVFDINTKAPLIYNKEILTNPSFIAVSDVSLIQCF